MLSRMVRPVMTRLPRWDGSQWMAESQRGITKVWMPASVSSRGLKVFRRRSRDDASSSPLPPGVPRALPGVFDWDFFGPSTNDEIASAVSSSPSPPTRNEAMMRLEITETPSEIMARAHLPGVKKEDLKVTLSPDNVLTISANRKEEEEGDSKTRYTDFTYGTLERAVVLPSSVDPDRISASMENGVLTIRCGKKEGEEHKPKAINVT